VHVRPVVDHVRYAEFRAVAGFLRALPAEPDVLSGQARPGVEVVMVEPRERPFLDAVAALDPAAATISRRPATAASGSGDRSHRK
jgi:hypothetical protein